MKHRENVSNIDKRRGGLILIYTSMYIYKWPFTRYPSSLFKSERDFVRACRRHSALVRCRFQQYRVIMSARWVAFLFMANKRIKWSFEKWSLEPIWGKWLYRIENIGSCVETWFKKFKLKYVLYPEYSNSIWTFEKMPDRQKRDNFFSKQWYWQ